MRKRANELRNREKEKHNDDVEWTMVVLLEVHANIYRTMIFIKSNRGVPE